MTTTVVFPDLDAAKDLMRKILSENPDNLNPTMVHPLSKCLCLYANAKGEHCVAGEFLSRLGVPDAELIGEYSGARVVLDLFGCEDPAVIHLMACLQSMADSVQFTIVSNGVAIRTDVSIQNNPRPWGQVLELAEAAGVL